VNSGFGQFSVQVRQLRLSAKNDVLGIFDLHEPPMAGAEGFFHRAVSRSDIIEKPMDDFRLEPVAEILGRIPVVALNKCSPTTCSCFAGKKVSSKITQCRKNARA